MYNSILVVAFAVFGTAIIAAAPLFDDDIGLRIIGGKSAQDGQFPYQVSLQTGIGKHICSGSIISDEWILTAAHCVRDVWQAIDAVVGTNNHKKGGVRYKVSNKMIHQKFDAENKTNDIAVLQLERKIALNTNIATVRLPDPTETSSGLNMNISGWGATSDKSTALSTMLQYANLTTITIEQCRMLLPEQYIVGHTNVCTLGQSKLGACKGDSGDPLVYNNVQHGVLSYFVKCGIPYPDVYSSVAAYRVWINSITGV